MSWPVISDILEVQMLYATARKNLARDARKRGVKSDPIADHRFAEMLALRSPPQSKTEREFLAGMGTLDKQYDGDEMSLNATVASARKHGYNPTTRDVYCAPIARFDGDPEAFIPPSGGRDYVKKVCERRGWECRGAVTTKKRDPERDPFKEPKVKLGRDIVDQEVARRVKQSKGKKLDLREVREEIVDKHSVKL